jgi:carbamoyl-phosphate synthase small subunit
MVRCFLVLEDGTVLEGVSFGHDGTVLGEVVFTTCMSGYQESITDPSCKGQILVSAFPLVGNYGVCSNYDVSGAVHAAGLVVRECCAGPSDMYGGRTLHEYLKEQKVSGISGIDTRDVIAAIRNKGSMNAAIVHDERDLDAVKKKLKGPGKEGLVSHVSTNRIKRIDNGKDIAIGILDCGLDRRMIDDLSSKYDVVVFPYDTKARDITATGVKALIISSGPGNPGQKDVSDVIRTIKELSPSMPMAGVALGAQAIAMAFGCRTSKLKFGHHGCSQPVKHNDSVYITSQNHMYTIDRTSMKGTGLIMDQVNVNDGTLEGFSHVTLPIFGIQYRPVSQMYEKYPYFYVKLDSIAGARK